jgi:hypothetical protein
MPLPRSIRIRRVGKTKAKLPRTSRFKNIGFTVKKIPFNR